ncbi:MAG: hypothetical protein KDA24_26125, partial [Deltaproteobacteria bacterium]|nr:hypothetical protein [Deltaproteobacteria bacterium]
MIVLPLASNSSAPAGIAIVPSAPTALIRLSVTTIVPRSMTSSPSIVMMRAPVNAVLPDGLARGTSSDIV